MAAGKKTYESKVYEIMMSYFDTGNFNETSRILNIPVMTVHDIYKRNCDKPEFIELREVRKKQFVNNATRIIEKAMNRLEKQIEDNDTPIPANQLSTVIGILYDKQALASGNPTSNTSVTIEDVLKKVDSKNEY